jgi:hypothetical protein
MEATIFWVSPSTLAVRSSAIVVRRSASADRPVGSAANSGKATTPANIKINVAVDSDLFMSVWRRSDHLTMIRRKFVSPVSVFGQEALPLKRRREFVIIRAKRNSKPKLPDTSAKLTTL